MTTAIAFSAIWVVGLALVCWRLWVAIKRPPRYRSSPYDHDNHVGAGLRWWRGSDEDTQRAANVLPIDFVKYEALVCYYDAWARGVLIESVIRDLPKKYHTAFRWLMGPRSDRTIEQWFNSVGDGVVEHIQSNFRAYWRLYEAFGLPRHLRAHEPFPDPRRRPDDYTPKQEYAWPGPTFVN